MYSDWEQEGREGLTAKYETMNESRDGGEEGWNGVAEHCVRKNELNSHHPEPLEEPCAWQ